MYALEPLPKIVPQNFPGDRDYTLEALKEELALMERHLRDGSWRLCNCNPEKHLPLLAGLSSEGFGFTDDPDEKEFMRQLRDRARIWRAKIQEGKFTDKDADNLRDWARELRHRIEFKTWSGPLEETPEFRDVVEQVNALSRGLTELEESHVDKILTILSKKHGIKKPPYSFVNDCNPLKDAWQTGKDLILKTDDGDTMRIPLIHSDQLVFCRGGASPYAISHEFCHHLQRVKEGSTDEKFATECGLNEVGNTLNKIENKLTVEDKRESLNTLSIKRNSGGNMAEDLMNYVPLVAGVFAGELVDEMGYIDQFTAPIAPGFAGILKAGVGAGVIYLGYSRTKGDAKDFLIGMGAPLVVSGLKQQFLGPAPALRARALATGVPVPPTRLTPYAVPTGLYRGHPTLAAPMIPPRPGILYPPQMTQYQRMQEPALGGKWMLGGPGR